MGTMITKFFLKHYGWLWVLIIFLIWFVPATLALILQHYTDWPTWVYALIALIGIPCSIIADIYMLEQRQKDPDWDPWDEI